VGNLTAGNKKTAPSVFHSEPFFGLKINFQVRSAYPLTLLFIGSPLFALHGTRLTLVVVTIKEIIAPAAISVSPSIQSQ
jgi:hypothetical protein